MFFLLWKQFGPLSERCEITTAPGAPEQCKAPSTTSKSPTCVVVSWEVRNVVYYPSTAKNCTFLELLFVARWQAPPCNGAPVTEFRLEWGAAEGTMQVCYSGSALSHEMRGLLPATNYFCRVQVSSTGIPQPLEWPQHHFYFKNILEQECLNFKQRFQICWAVWANHLANVL